MQEETTNGVAALRERIAAAPKWRGEMFEVKEWGVTVEIRSLTMGQRAHFAKVVKPDSKGIATTGLDQTYFEILRMTVFDPDSGKPLFKDGDLAFLQSLDPVPIEALVTKSMDLSGLSKKAKAELGKDSEVTD